MPNEVRVEAVVPTLLAVCPPESDGDDSSPSKAFESGVRVVDQTARNLVAGRYRLDSVLAEGGMCIVYKAWHMTLDQPIAVKVLRPDYVDLPEAVERFQAEARSLALLRGKHCVQVMDVGAMTDGTPFMVLELLEGCDLRRVLRERGPLSVAATTSFMLQTARAVSEVHALGLIHRDLKPENLFLAREVGKDVIKLIDFGISKSLLETSSHATQVDSCLGSPHFMSPEQVRSATAVDTRTDVWSLGATFYELVTGHTPFQGNTLVSICASIICDEPPAAQRLRADLPAALEQVIMRCLMKDRELRYPNMQAIVDDLLQFEIDSIEVTPCSSGGTPLAIEAPVSAPPALASTWTSKRKIWAIATATLFSVGVSAAVIEHRLHGARAGTDESAAPRFGGSAEGAVAPKAQQPSSERIASSVASDRPREIPAIEFEQLAEAEPVVQVPSQNQRWRLRYRPTKRTPVRTGAVRSSTPRAAQQGPRPVSDASIEARYGLSAAAR